MGHGHELKASGKGRQALGRSKAMAGTPGFWDRPVRDQTARIQIIGARASAVAANAAAAGALAAGIAAAGGLVA